MATGNYKQVFAKFKAQRVKAAPLEIAREVASNLSEKIVLLTPVDTTRAEANWIADLNTVPLDFDEAKRNLSGGRSNLERARQIANRMELGDVFVIANSTPYIGYLENGSSQQAPAGMRDVTAAAFPRIVRAAIERKARRR